MSKERKPSVLVPKLGRLMTLVTPNTSSFAADSKGWAAEGSPVTVSSQGAIAAPARRADSLTFLDIPSSRLFSGSQSTISESAILNLTATNCSKSKVFFCYEHDTRHDTSRYVMISLGYVVINPRYVQWNLGNKSKISESSIPTETNYSKSKEFFVTSCYLVMLYIIMVCYVMISLDESHRNARADLGRGSVSWRSDPMAQSFLTMAATWANAPIVPVAIVEARQASRGPHGLSTISQGSCCCRE